MDFVIVNSEQHSEFDDFKRAMTDRNCVLLSSNALLDYWNDFVRRVSQSTITVYGQKHHKLHYTEMDQLIEWVMRKTGKYNNRKNFVRILISCRVGRLWQMTLILSQMREALNR